MPGDWPPDDISGFYLSRADSEKRASRQSLDRAKKAAGVRGKRERDIVLDTEPARRISPAGAERQAPTVARKIQGNDAEFKRQMRARSMSKGRR